MDAVEEEVVAALVSRAEAIASLANQPEQPQESPQIQQLRHQVEGLKGLGDNPAIAEAIGKIEQEIKFLQGQTQAQSQQQSNLVDMLLAFSNELYWQTLLDEEKKVIYRALVGRVVVRYSTVVRVNLKV